MAGRAPRLTVLAANLRGFRTNVGEFSHLIVKHRADVAIVTETFLDDKVPQNYAKMKGYSKWYRRDRKSGQGGGVAVCHHSSLHVQQLFPELPDHFEMMFFKLITSSCDSVLVVACYRPRWQGQEPIKCLTSNLDEIMTINDCKNVIIAGDLNHYLVQAAFDRLVEVQGLQNYVTFSTHIRGSSLDPMLTDIPDAVKCESLGPVGTSDHFTIKTTIFLYATREEPYEKTEWLWKKANWSSLQHELKHTEWEALLNGTVDQKIDKFTDYILQCQAKWVPSQSFQVKSTDLPWFGYQCSEAARRKYQAWIKLKKRPSLQNQRNHRRTCNHMKKNAAWARKHWQEDLKEKLSQGNIGTRQWWNITKLQQGLARDDLIPPLIKDNGTNVTQLKEKLHLLGQHFAEKMKVENDEREVPSLHLKTNEKISTVTITEQTVRDILKTLNTSKATGPDEISPNLLRNCADELSGILAQLFTDCLKQQTWPKIWKSGRVIPVHKKEDKSKVKNYRPVTLLSVISKVMEKVLVDPIKEHLEKK